MPTPNPVFICYAHKDNDNSEPSKRWLDRLCEHLEPLVQEDNITLCSDQDIELGDDWHDHLQQQLTGARAAVLLISPAFLASKYIRNSELPALLKNAEDNGVRIIPVILRPCMFAEAKFKYSDPKTGTKEFWLSSLQAAGSANQALSEMTEGEQDRALLKVAQALGKLVHVAGRIEPFELVGAGTQPPRHRRLLHALEQAIGLGELRDSELGPRVLETLQAETEVELVKPYDPKWITTGIRVADFYFRKINPSAGERDWQRDFAKTATPILVGVARSLQRSADAQAVLVKLCEVVAQRLRLQLTWPADPDEVNDVRNTLYRACLDSHEVESDEVLVVLQGLTVVGPG